MAFELVLLGALIFIFIVSFCGLLQKIKQTYDRERLLAERIARRRAQQRNQRGSAGSFQEIYSNPAFRSDTLDEGVFPAAPPPYSQYYTEPPPKYEEIVKVHEQQNNTSSEAVPEGNPSSTDTGPPPYTINISLVNEAANRH